MAKNLWTWAGMVFALLLTTGVRAGDLPRAQPHEVGFFAERLAYMEQFYNKKVQRGEMAGMVLLIARHGRVVYFNAIGYADVERLRPMQTDTIFRLYSMTKPITATALMILYEEGHFQLTEPLSKYLPEFAGLRVLRSPDGPLEDTDTLEREPTIQDTLRHTAGFSHGLTSDAHDAQYTKLEVFDPDISLAEMMLRLAKIPLRHQPGTKFHYGLGADVQARLVEVFSGLPFDVFLEQRLFKPLGMKDTRFSVPAEKAKRLATVHSFRDGRLVTERQEIDIDTANPKRKDGSFGLVSTAEEYWRFAQMLLNGGELDGARLLSPRVVGYMTRDHLGAIDIEAANGWPAGTGWGLGLAVMKDPVATGSLLSEGSFYHAGNTSYCWVDPKEDLVIVAMTQHLGVPGVEMLWAQIPALVYSALVD